MTPTAAERAAAEGRAGYEGDKRPIGILGVERASLASALQGAMQLAVPDNERVSCLVSIPERRSCSTLASSVAALGPNGGCRSLRRRRLIWVST